MIQAAKYIGTGLSAIALIGPGIGIGLVFASMISSIARNPSLETTLFQRAIFSFALVEAIALFCLMLAFLILFA